MGCTRVGIPAMTSLGLSHSSGPRYEQRVPVHCPSCRGRTSLRENWLSGQNDAIAEFTEITVREMPQYSRRLSFIRPDVVRFDEGMGPNVLDAAWGRADGCDVLLTFGANRQVEPVAGIPWRAAYRGVKAIEINPSPQKRAGFGRFGFLAVQCHLRYFWK